MTTILKQIELIERIDQLIRMEATGTAIDLANRLGVSRATLYRIIEMMKELNAPIEYDFTVQSFVYAEAVGFRFGFYVKDLPFNEMRSVSGGNSFQKLHFLATFS
ncbi:MULTISPECIES: HTH domain-containing protein [Aquimarina]|uniref:HTH domain-containing protein n=1 Tax=Aquimarina algiphila TaxID=2047982 RepID=A0A554VNY2_9FLAO|nr:MULTISPECIES: HTH domain-containing protein [Aquimarina]TSE10104.1 HTH domain-containing protein [Aquimarina algiphila]